MDRISKLREFLQSNPNDSFVKHALALEYIKIADEATAKGIFEEILTHDPGYVGSYYHLAKLLERTGDINGAIAWYEKGIVAAQQAGDRHALGELRSAYEELTF